MAFKPLVIKVKAGYIPSVNQMFAGRTKNLSEIARTYKSNIYQALDSLNIPVSEWQPDGSYGFIYEEYDLSLELHFILTDSYYRRDTDNMIKFTQDVLFEWLEVNDHMVSSVKATKFYAPSADQEYVIFILKPDETDLEAYEKKFRE